MEYIIPIYALGDQDMAKIRARTGRNEPTVPRAAYEKAVADCKAMAANYDLVVAKYNDLAAEHKEMAAKYARAQDVIGALAGLLRRGDASGEARGGNEHVDEVERLLDMMVAAQNGRGARGDGRHLVWFRSALLDEYIQDDNLLHDLTLLEPIVFEYVAYRVEEYVEGQRFITSDLTRLGRPDRHRSRVSRSLPYGLCITTPPPA